MPYIISNNVQVDVWSLSFSYSVIIITSITCSVSTYSFSGSKCVNSHQCVSVCVITSADPYYCHTGGKNRMKNQRGRGRGGMRGRGGRGGSRGRGRGKMGGENDDGDGMYGDEMEVGHNSQVINTKQSSYRISSVLIFMDI